MIITKEIDLGEGCKFGISSLTYEQVEELMDTPIPEDAKGQRERAWKEVLQSARNFPGQQDFTQGDIRAKLDLAFLPVVAIRKFSELRRAVLEISGYEMAKPGEAAAAPASPSTSDGSAAA